MYAVDSLASAQDASRPSLDDPRLTQPYDPKKISGLEFTVGLGSENGEVAQELILFFDVEDGRIDRLPQRVEWVHPLRGRSWADSARLDQGRQLTQKLGEIISKLIPGVNG